MGTPEDHFQNIDLTQIDSFVAARREEDLHLDFKTSSADLERPARKNLAEAVSGFANADGGVIVWGVGARPGPPDGTDCAQELQPIAPLSRFLSKLNEHTGSAASPSVDGVVHRVITRGADEGFALTLVPASDVTPHMAKLGVDRYMKRSGSQFLKMEHFEVEDMFGRRRRPVLELATRLKSGATMGGGPRPTLREALVFLALKNRGRGSASAPYLRLGVAPPFAIYPSGASAGDAARMPEIPGGSKLDRCFAAGTDFVVHPGPQYQVARITTSLAEHESSHPDLVLEYELAAEHFRRQTGTIRVSAAELYRAVGRGVEVHEAEKPRS